MRLLQVDVLAIGVFVVVTASLFYDMYSLGAHAAVASSVPRDGLWARVVGEAVVASLAFAWLAYRAVVGGYRPLAGSR